MMRLNIAFAALAGLILRLFLVLTFPMGSSGDAPFYIELAWNWLKIGVYGLPVNGQLLPVDVRVPGYPAFLAAIFTFAGNSPRAVMLAQAFLDLGTCFVIALIAARLAPPQSRRRVALAGLWLAALCPFIANYSAVLLTETLVTFLTALALLVLLETDLARPKDIPDSVRVSMSRRLSPWFLGGIVAGFGTLVRPETPLLLVAVAFVAIAKWWRPINWPKLLRASALMSLGLVIPLLPWAARNWRTFHEMRFLAPRYTEMPGEFTPLGFNAWTNTWLWKFGDVYLTQWKLDDEEIPPADIPASAFDSPQQQERVTALLDQYNDTLTMEPPLDAQFGEIARERTARASRPHVLRNSVPSLADALVHAARRTASVQRSPLAAAREMGRRYRDFLGDPRPLPLELRVHCAGARGNLDCAAATGRGSADCVHPDPDRIHRAIRRNAGAALRSGVLSRRDCPCRAGLRRAASIFSHRLRMNG